jgi:hypothetical protein
VGVGLVGLGLNAADEGALWLRTMQGDCAAFGKWAALQQLGAADGLLPFGDVLAAGMLLPGRSTLERHFRMYPSSSFKCDRCADAVAKALAQTGHEVSIVRIQWSTSAQKMVVKDTSSPSGMRLVGDTGFHEVVEVDGEFYIDSIVYESFGAKAIPWDEYANLWMYPEDLVQVSRRAPR